MAERFFTTYEDILSRAYAGTLKNWVRTYGGYFDRWQGSTANVQKVENQEVKGSLVHITEEELLIMNGYECYPDVYERDNVLVETEKGQVNSVVYY